MAEIGERDDGGQDFRVKVSGSEFSVSVAKWHGPTTPDEEAAHH